MPLAISLDEGRDLLIARASGDLSALEITEEFAAAIRQTNGAALHKDVLFVLNRDVALHLIDLKALHDIKSEIEAWGSVYPGRSVRTGFVVPDTINRSAVKLWQSLAESFPRIGAHVRIFSSEDQAVRWLR